MCVGLRSNIFALRSPVNPDCFYLPGLTFLVPAHPGSPSQSPGGRKTAAAAAAAAVAAVDSRTHITTADRRSVNFVRPSVYSRRSCLSCRWSKTVEQSSWWCYICLVTTSLQEEQTKNLLISPLLWHSLTFRWLDYHVPPLTLGRLSASCNNLNCIGHSKNDDDDDDDVNDYERHFVHLL